MVLPVEQIMQVENVDGGKLAAFLMISLLLMCSHRDGDGGIGDLIILLMRIDAVHNDCREDDSPFFFMIVLVACCCSVSCLLALRLPGLLGFTRLRT